MDITPALSEGKLLIRSYGNGSFQINELQHVGSVLLLRNTVQPWSVMDPEDLNFSSLRPIVLSSDDVDVLLIGTGEHSEKKISVLRTRLADKGINVYVMSTGAACRTYNVLVHEDLLVAAALIAI